MVDEEKWIDKENCSVLGNKLIKYSNSKNNSDYPLNILINKDDIITESSDDLKVTTSSSVTDLNIASTPQKKSVAKSIFNDLKLATSSSVTDLNIASTPQKKSVAKSIFDDLKVAASSSVTDINIASTPQKKSVTKSIFGDLKVATSSSVTDLNIASTPQKKNVVKEQENNQSEIIAESLKETKHTFLVNRNIEEINNILMKVNWGQISDDWTIDLRGYGNIILNPYEKCSKVNPLYMHKEWLNWIYTNKDLDLNDQDLAQICDCKNIGYWRQKFNIQTKESGRYINPNGYIELYMPKEYKHPELNPMGEIRISRKEHVVKMEEYLMNSLTPKELSVHPCLIKGEDGRYYIKIECPVHHINYRKHDNYITNLWVSENKSEHNNNDINKCLSGLIKLGQIFFSNEDKKYYINKSFNYRRLTRNQITEIVKPVEFFRFDDINLIQEQIKKEDWSGIDWTIEVSLNKIASKKIYLDPYKNCSKENPLYMHKAWMERIVNNSQFNLTDSRLAELCGITEDTAYRWRHLYHKIPKENWGFEKYLHKLKNTNKIVIKVPRSYGNPFAHDKNDWQKFVYMLEHRYVMEQFLAQNPKINQEYLLDEKYLKPECVVHHINLDNLDNRLENLCVYRTHSNHEEIHSSLFDLIDDLLKEGFLIFKEGKYLLNY